MDKVRQFIKDYTRGCSNETTPLGSFDHTYHEWLTPEQALAAVEIAREELIDKACEWLLKHDSYAVPTNIKVRDLKEHLSSK